MNIFALATDYDGTLAYDGHVREPTICALEKLSQSGKVLGPIPFKITLEKQVGDLISRNGSKPSRVNILKPKNRAAVYLAGPSSTFLCKSPN